MGSSLVECFTQADDLRLERYTLVRFRRLIIRVQALACRDRCTLMMGGRRPLFAHSRFLLRDPTKLGPNLESSRTSGRGVSNNVSLSVRTSFMSDMSLQYDSMSLDREIRER